MIADPPFGFATRWLPCPGGPGLNVLPGRTFQCPGCGYEFATTMDAPVVPAHLISDDGAIVMFRPPERTVPHA